MQIGFIGIGKLGLPCAEVIANKGHKVLGYDIVKKTSQVIKIVDSIKECVAESDIVFVAVPTPHEAEYDGSLPSSHLYPKDFNYSIVETCLTEANKFMNRNQLLVLISTVLPGTTRTKFSPMITNTRFIYNPYLIAMGSVAWDMVNPEMVMIGTDNGSETGDARLLKEFYMTIMENNPRYLIGTWDECECVKVFYNTFISAKISLVNMIQDVAMKQGNINVDVVTEALAKSTMRIMGPQYMKAGMGDGGACHPRDNIALRHIANKLDLGYDLFDAIMKSREIQAKNLANYLIEQAELYKMKIYIHGKSYKPGVSYLDGSYSLLIAHFCEENGFPVNFIDPNTGDLLEECFGVVLLAHSASTTYGYTEIDASDQLYCRIASGSVVVDPWRNFYSDEHVVLHYGNTRSN